MTGLQLNRPARITAFLEATAPHVETVGEPCQPAGGDADGSRAVRAGGAGGVVMRLGALTVGGGGGRLGATTGQGTEARTGGAQLVDTDHVFAGPDAHQPPTSGA